MLSELQCKTSIGNEFHILPAKYAKECSIKFARGADKVSIKLLARARPDVTDIFNNFKSMSI